MLTAPKILTILGVLGEKGADAVPEAVEAPFAPVALLDEAAAQLRAVLKKEGLLRVEVRGRPCALYRQKMRAERRSRSFAIIFTSVELKYNSFPITQYLYLKQQYNPIRFYILEEVTYGRE